jgi:hypothetical protein
LPSLNRRKQLALQNWAQADASENHAPLFPFIFIRKSVWTPAGPGEPLSADAEQCEILPDGAAKTIRARTKTKDVRPIQ